MAKKKLQEAPEGIEGEVAQAEAQVARGATQESRDRVAKLSQALTKYQAEKEALDNRIIENDRWYRSQHWSIWAEQSDKPRDPQLPEPVSNYLFNTLANRHGDLMDAFPEPVFTEREQSDYQTAQDLSKVVKVDLERNKFRRTYSANGWYKEKSGTACYGVFWDQSMEGGLGDIAVKKVDILRLYWEPGIEDIQESEYVFALSLVDYPRLKKKYPILAETNGGDASAMKVKQFSEAEKIDLSNKAVVVDCYYKETDENGKDTVHLDKYSCGLMLASTKWPNGKGELPTFYKHGKYPFVFDVCYPEEHSICGFGLVDVVKSPQQYIDKLNQILLKNAAVSGKDRYIAKQGLFPVDQLMDLSRDVIEVNGSVERGKDYDVLSTKPLPIGIIQHRNNMISEMKEISGINDFNRGGSGGGVTAASAIMALQEAGNKLSRADVTNTYDAFTEICYLMMELIAQFYTEARVFRITNDTTGKTEYKQFDNSKLQPQPMPSSSPAVKPEERRPIFDVTVHAEKYSPYAALAANEIAKELYKIGFFAPENAMASLTALDLMSFDGKDRIVSKLRMNGMQQLQMQQLQQQNQQLMQTLQQMNQYIQQVTGGKDMLAGSTFGAQQPGQPGQQQLQAPQQQPQLAAGGQV